MPSVADFVWTGHYGNDATDPGNWKVNGFLNIDNLLPGPDDVVSFIDTYSVPCANLVSTDGSFEELRIDAGYESVVSLGDDLTVNQFYQDDGTLDQPTAGQHLTVNVEWLWTNGTLNSLSTGGTIHIVGYAGGRVEPGTNALTTGSTISFEDHSTGTFVPTSLTFANDATLTVDSDSDVTFENYGETDDVVAGDKEVTVNGTLTYVGKHTFSQGLYVNGGVFRVIGNGSEVTYNGRVGAGGGAPSILVQGSTGEIRIANGATLKGTNGVKLEAGKLSSIAGAGTTATLIGNVNNTGADVVIGNGTDPHAYGILYIDGTFTMSGGTYRPVIKGDENGKCDQLVARFNITVGGSAALHPGTLGTVGANSSWTYLSSTQGNVGGSWPSMVLTYSGGTYQHTQDANPAKSYMLKTP